MSSRVVEDIDERVVQGMSAVVRGTFAVIVTTRKTLLVVVVVCLPQ